MSREAQHQSEHVDRLKIPSYSEATFEDPALSNSEMQEAFDKAFR